MLVMVQERLAEALDHVAQKLLEKRVLKKDAPVAALEASQATGEFEEDEGFGRIDKGTRGDHKDHTREFGGDWRVVPCSPCFVHVILAHA
eukprot:5251227-Amphidinium_carterae.1